MSLRRYSVVVNGEALPVDDVPPHTTLLDLLRTRGLTGAKEGCAEGECGACAVVMVTGDGTGSRYSPVNSCLIFVPSAVDREFYTVEALAQNGEPAEVQSAMAMGGASQCGYCTPGFVISLFAEQYRPGRTGPCDPHSMSGNLCRCTGYRPIRDAAATLGPAPAGFFRDRLLKPAPAIQTVQLSIDGVQFDRPSNLAESFDLASRSNDAKWISGATDLAVEANLRFRRWKHLISLEAVPELREFVDGPDSVIIGSALSLDRIGRSWTAAPAAVGDWLRLFASPLIRNRATLGGSLATASPIGDSAPLLLALNASLRLESIRGSRTVPLAGFFTGYRTTQLDSGELIRSIEIPKPFPAYTRFYKVSKRRADDISTLAAGLSIDVDGAGRVKRAIFAFGGVGAVPLRAYSAENLTIGEPWNELTLKRIEDELQASLQPIDDHRGSAAYRRAMAKNSIAKFYRDWCSNEASK